MVSWQVLGEQAVRLSVADRLALLWKIVRSLFVWGRAPESTATIPDNKTSDGDRASSVLEASGPWIGVGAGLGDLSINPIHPDADEAPSFLEAAGPWIGVGEGPGDLSTNSAYMEGYGR